MSNEDEYPDDGYHGLNIIDVKAINDDENVDYEIYAVVDGDGCVEYASVSRQQCINWLRENWRAYTTDEGCRQWDEEHPLPRRITPTDLTAPPPTDVETHNLVIHDGMLNDDEGDEAMEVCYVTEQGEYSILFVAASQRECQNWINAHWREYTDDDVLDEVDSGLV